MTRRWRTKVMAPTPSNTTMAMAATKAPARPPPPVSCFPAPLAPPPVAPAPPDVVPLPAAGDVLPPPELLPTVALGPPDCGLWPVFWPPLGELVVWAATGPATTSRTHSTGSAAHSAAGAHLRRLVRSIIGGPPTQA